MFETPKQMVTKVMRHYTSDVREYIEDEITEYKAQAVKMLHKLIDPLFANAIAVTIAYAVENELEEALDIVNRTGLTDKHLAALRDDFEMMCLLIENELAENKHYAYGA